MGLIVKMPHCSPTVWSWPRFMAKSSLSACQLIFAFLFKATLNLEHRNLTQVKTLPCKPQSSRGKTFPSARYGTDLRITNKFYVILSKSQTPVSWDIWPKKGNSRFWQDCQKSFCLFCTMFKTNVPSYTKMKQWCLIQLLPISLQLLSCCWKHLQSQVSKADVPLHFNYFAWDLPRS